MNEELISKTESLQQQFHEQIVDVIKQSNKPNKVSHQDFMNVMLIKEIAKLQIEIEKLNNIINKK
jgi:hypothetical protein